MRKLSHVFIGMGVVLLLQACSIDSADRCGDGLEWDPDKQWCLGPNSGQDSDSEEYDAGVFDSGLGEVCNGDPDCADFDATYCLLNPLSPDDPGVCTIIDCVGADCLGDYYCCDCDSVSFISWPGPACVPGIAVAEAEAYGCSCE